MTEAPDEKTQAELNAATKTRKPGDKWRVRVAVALTIVLLVGGGLFIVEAYRQSQISSARMEFAAEIQLVHDRYADVNDWPQWYHDQLPSGSDHQDLAAWIKNCRDSRVMESTVWNWAKWYDEPDFPDNKKRPDTGQLSQFLEDTEPLAQEAQRMLRYQSVSRLPEFEDGAPSLGILPALRAFVLLTHRARVFQELGKLDEAWNELARALRLVQKWDHPVDRFDLGVCADTERKLHFRVAELAQTQLPTTAMVEGLREQPEIRTALKREMIENELAYFSQLMAGRSPDDPPRFFHLTEGERGVWFDYLSPELDWDGRKESFQARGMIVEALAEYLRQVRTTLETPGARVDDLDDKNPFRNRLKSIPSDLNEMALLRQGSSLLCSVLLAQQYGDLDSVMAQAVADFPDHEVYLDGELVVIRVRYSKRLAAELPCGDMSEEEFYELYEPVRLPLKP